MTSATITPIVRELSWNVNFTVGEKATPSDRFAGIYQVPGKHIVTFRDVCHELWLCFEGILGEQGNSSDNPWANIAFALYDSPESNLSLETRNLSFVTGELLANHVPTLPTSDTQKKNVLTYHIVSHKNCYLPSSPLLKDHLKGKLALEYASFNFRLILTSLQKGVRTTFFMLSGVTILDIYRSSDSKRSQSSSPINESFDSDEEFEDILAPESVKEDLARQTPTSFRDKVLSRGDCCVVSRKGKPWCSAIGISPTIEACHIVPQLHYFLYPVEQAEDNEDKHLTAWTQTWGFGNGILLRKDLRQLFDARAFSIHPQEGTIRVFLPSDELIEFNGKKALLHDDVDRRALRHHYEMCCIENMSALPPDMGGVGSPVISRKRQRTPEDGDLAEEEEEEAEAEAASRGNERGYNKRRRLSECQVVADAESPAQAYYHSADEEDVDGYDQCITPANCREFLEIVNWELRRFRDGQLAS
ncbi:hypothetical protein F4679DRAFT_588838 [Xylaria curta]|nr:hypothetical protein F4679DRAFT_588838 [Xylaria curta]